MSDSSIQAKISSRDDFSTSVDSTNLHELIAADKLQDAMEILQSYNVSLEKDDYFTLILLSMELHIVESAFLKGISSMKKYISNKLSIANRLLILIESI